MQIHTKPSLNHSVAKLASYGFVVISLLTSFSSLKGSENNPALSLNGFDKSIHPGDDFFDFVNGEWVKKTKIPSDKSRWGSFVILAEKSKENVLTIIKDVSDQEGLEEGSPAQQIRDLYRSYFDRDRLNELGISPIESDLFEIDVIAGKRKLASYWAKANRSGIPNPFSFYVSQDAKDSSVYRVHLSQGGLGLPDRDYYLEDDERSKSIQIAYKKYLKDIFKLAGLSNAKKKSERVYDLEKKLATIQWSRVENRDRIKTYNKFNRSDLSRINGSFQWRMFLNEAGISNEKEFIIRQPSFFKSLSSIIDDTPLGVWRDYLRARVISNAAPYLDDNFFGVNFEFYSRVLSGQNEPEPLSKRATSLVNGVLGEPIGKIYVERHFPPEAKSKMLDLVENIKVAMEESINNLEWMDKTTQTRALDKLKKFKTKIGYPDKWKDYSKLTIKSDDLIGNLKRASEFSFETNIKKLGGPIDRDEWFMTPQTVNAYYNPRLNEIVFPAAILQPPFFNLSADDAVNYGGIGMVIGHEIGHGFDDQGRKSDGNGNLVDWWTQSSADAYESRAQEIVKQYNNYQPVNGFNVNGQLTLGENIGDLGGLTLAWKAYQNSLKNQPAPDPIDGFTHEQRFFISYAQIWRIKSTTEQTIRRIKTDTHSPPKFRVNGPLRNFQPFYEVFGLENSNAMWFKPESRVSIW